MIRYVLFRLLISLAGEEVCSAWFWNNFFALSKSACGGLVRRVRHFVQHLCFCKFSRMSPSSRVSCVLEMGLDDLNDQTPTMMYTSSDRQNQEISFLGALSTAVSTVATRVTHAGSSIYSTVQAAVTGVTSFLGHNEDELLPLRYNARFPPPVPPPISESLLSGPEQVRPPVVQSAGLSMKAAGDHGWISHPDRNTGIKGWTSNGSWCIGIKGEMSGTVCVTFTWDIYIYIWVVYSFCLFCCLFIIVTWWYMWCIVWQVASKRKYRHVW